MTTQRNDADRSSGSRSHGGTLGDQKGSSDRGRKNVSQYGRDHDETVRQGRATPAMPGVDRTQPAPGEEAGEGQAVPDEFEQAARRADFHDRAWHQDEALPGSAGGTQSSAPERGAPQGEAQPPRNLQDEYDELAYMHASRDRYPTGGEGRGAAGSRAQGRPDYGSSGAFAGDPQPGNTSPQTGSTSGYDDYETETVYGRNYEQGDWPRRYRNAEHDSEAKPLGEHAENEKEVDEARPSSKVRTDQSRQKSRPSS